MKPGSVDILESLYNLDLDSLFTGTGPMTKRSSLFVRYHESYSVLFFLPAQHHRALSKHCTTDVFLV